MKLKTDEFTAAIKDGIKLSIHQPHFTIGGEDASAMDFAVRIFRGDEATAEKWLVQLCAFLLDDLSKRALVRYDGVEFASERVRREGREDVVREEVVQRLIDAHRVLWEACESEQPTPAELRELARRTGIDSEDVALEMAQIMNKVN